MGEPAEDRALDALLRRAGQGQPGPADAAQADALIRRDPVTDVLRGIDVDLTGTGADRLAAFARCAHLCPAVCLEVAGHEVDARVSREELWRFYLPLSGAIVRLAGRAERRLLIGIAGPGGSGKSVLAELLRRVLACAEGLPAALCPLDGFHYPNRHLDAHSTRAPDGRSVPLRQVKGAPQTFEVEAFLDALRRLRAGEAVALPAYDRRLHDPVPGRIRVERRHRAALVEGNYLLLQRGAWAQVADLLDLAIFVAVPPEMAERALIERHVRGGRSPEDARRHFERSDRRNVALCMTSAARADLVLRRDASHRLHALQSAL